MRIKSIHLKNFRSFTENDFYFPSNFSVIYGPKDSGKTTAIDGLSVALGGWFHGFDGIGSKDKREIKELDIMSLFDSDGKAIVYQTPAVVGCVADIDEKEYSWERSLLKKSSRTTIGGLSKIKQHNKKINDKIYSGDDFDVILPLIVRYDSTKLWDERVDREEVIYKDKIRLHGYNHSIDFLNSISEAMIFFDKIAYLAYREDRAEYIKKMDLLVSAIKSAVYIPNVDFNLYYNMDSFDFCVEGPSGSEKSCRELSYSYRYVINVMVDIFYRLFSLNPHIDADKIKLCNGVVLIDDIDLNLDDNHKKHFVSNLKSILPNMQFIATANSKEFIGLFEKNELIFLC